MCTLLNLTQEVRKENVMTKKPPNSLEDLREAVQTQIADLARFISFCPTGHLSARSRGDDQEALRLLESMKSRYRTIVDAVGQHGIRTAKPLSDIQGLQELLGKLQELQEETQRRGEGTDET